MQIIEDFIAARERDVERDLANRINIADLDAVEQLKFIIRRVATPQLRLPRYHRKLEEILVNLIGFENIGSPKVQGNAEALSVISNNLDMAVRWICLEELTELEYLELEEEPSGSISIYGTSRLQREYDLSLPAPIKLSQQELEGAVASGEDQIALDELLEMLES